MTRTLKQPSHAVPSDLGHELTKGFTGRRIRFRAFQLAGTCGFSRSDRDDLEQELRLAVMTSIPKYTPERGPWNVFVFTVIERKILNYFDEKKVRQRMTEFEKDSFSTLISLNDQEETTLSQLILPDDQARINGRTVRHHVDETNREHDVATVLEHLPAELREMAELLMEDSPSVVARETRVPRRTLRGRLEAIAQAFVDHGLDDLEINRETWPDDEFEIFPEISPPPRSKIL